MNPYSSEQLSLPSYSPQNSYSSDLDYYADDILSYIRQTPYTGTGSCVNSEEYYDGNSYIREEVHEVRRPGVNCSIKVKRIKSANTSPVIRTPTTQAVKRRSLPARFNQTDSPEWYPVTEMMNRTPIRGDHQSSSPSTPPSPNFRSPHSTPIHRVHQPSNSVSISSEPTSDERSYTSKFMELCEISPAAAIYELIMNGTCNNFADDKERIRFLLDHVVAEKPFDSDILYEGVNLLSSSGGFQYQLPESYFSGTSGSPDRDEYGTSQNNRNKLVLEDNVNSEVDYDDSSSFEDDNEQLDSLAY